MSRAGADLHERRDGIICYCGKGVTNAEFVSDIRENQNLGFDQICALRGVGHQCTACLLDADALYYEAMADVDDAPAIEQAVMAEILDQPRAPGLKRRIFDLADRFLPKLAKPRRGIAPIFVSKSLTTTLYISNQYSDVIGPRNAPVRIRLGCYDESGQRFRMESHSLLPGERYDAPVGNWLADTTGKQRHGAERK